MRVSADELRRAREATEALLEEMGLAAYLYEVGASETGWMVRVECAVANGWQVVEIPVTKEDLLGAPRDARVRARLLQEWSDELGPCRRLGDS